MERSLLGRLTVFTDVLVFGIILVHKEVYYDIYQCT